MVDEVYSGEGGQGTDAGRDSNEPQIVLVNNTTVNGEHLRRFL
jgi:hypothetical protein